MNSLAQNIINQQQSSSSKYSVVFDIDDVLCTICDDTKTDGTEKLFAGSKIIDFHHKSRIYPHFFYPYFGEVMLALLEWGWNVYFFSSGEAIRNEDVIPRYFKKVLLSYIKKYEIDEFYNSLIETKRFGIYSHHHMVLGETDNSKITGFEVYGTYKKDLTVISPDIKNIVLIDDDRSYVVANQYPYIGLSFNSSNGFKHYIEKALHHYQDKQKSDELLKEFLSRYENYIPLNNALYVFGILLQCRELLDKGLELSLRDALGEVLHNKAFYDGESNIYNHTPWYLKPLPEANPKSQEFIILGQKTIDQCIKQWHVQNL